MRERGLATTGLAARVEDTVASGRDASSAAAQRGPPTAFVCACDTLAMGVLHTLAAPRPQRRPDVAVVGFDDSQAAQVVPPGLTSVRQPLEEVAVEVVGALHGLLARPRVVHTPRLLGPSLVVRGSG